MVLARAWLYRLEPFIEQLLADVCGQYWALHRSMVGVVDKTAAVVLVERSSSAGRCGWRDP